MFYSMFIQYSFNIHSIFNSIFIQYSLNVTQCHSIYTLTIYTQCTFNIHTHCTLNTCPIHSSPTLSCPPPASVHTTAMRSVDRMVTLLLHHRSEASEGSEGSEGVGLTSATCATLLTRVTRFFTHAKTLTRTSALSCASGLVLLCRASLTEEQVRVIVPGPLRLSRLKVIRLEVIRLINC